MPTSSSSFLGYHIGAHGTGMGQSFGGVPWLNLWNNGPVWRLFRRWWMIFSHDGFHGWIPYHILPKKVTMKLALWPLSQIPRSHIDWWMKFITENIIFCSHYFKKYKSLKNKDNDLRQYLLSMIFMFRN
jgi:hypothetical protein